MTAIFKRELKSYFASPVGYVVVAALAALYGFFYYQVMLTGASAYISEVYSSLYMFGMMIIPIITMKTMSEDRKNKTDQALLTAPISVTAIVMGKFLSAFALYAIPTVMGLLPALAMSTFSNPPWGIVIGNFISTLLYGGAMISIGVFISSLTESQIVAAIGTLAISLLLMCIDLLSAVFSNVKWITSATNFLSISSRFSDFTAGLIYYDNVIFFLTLQVLFLFLTVRVLDSKRWN